MSNTKNEITENINSQPQIRIQSFKNNNISQLSEKTKQIKVKNKYQYNYSNKNAISNNNKLSNISKINIKCIKSKNISISPHKKNNISPSKLNCETNYSINKINNTCYVNGLNKNISKINSARSPDLRFIPYENKEIYEKKKYIYDLKNTNFNTNYNRNSRLNKNRKEKIIDNTNVTNIKYDKYFTEKDSNLNMNTYLIENNNTIVKSSKKNNHSFRSISNCSKDNRSQSNPRKTSNERKYKCDIRIHNEYNNTSKENIRPFSFDNKNKKRKIKNTKEVFITDNSRINNNLEYELNRNKSFDGKCLKMQNSQNLQILQEEKLYQILIPIPPNETDHACHFQISPVKKKEKEKENKNIIEESEIITRKIFKKNIKQGKKTSWIKSTSPKKENSENLSKNSEESNRKFKGQMQIEKNALNFKRTPRNWNSQLKNEHQFSIEKKREKEKILSPTKAEKISIEGIKKNFNDLIIKNENNNFEIKSNVNKEEEEKEEKNIINDEEIGREIKRNVKAITQETKNGVENSESSSDYDALKQITNLNNKRYENIIKNSFEQNPNQRKVIINNIRRYYPYSNINQNNEIQINESLEIRNRNINYLSEFPNPELVMNPLYEENKLNEGTQYNYRQSITNKEQNESSKEHILEEENDILDSPTDTKVNHERKSTNLEESQSQGQTDVPSPKSQLREEFREEIISLSPRHMNNIEQINKMKEINYMEEEYKIYTSNMRQSEQLIENAEEQEQEQDELSQKERESNINFSFKMNMNNNNKYHLPKPKYQYICKTKSNKANKNKNNKYENRTVMTQVIDNNSIIKNSGMIMQNINNDNKYRYVNNNNIPNNIDENMGNLNMIYGSQKIQKNNDNSNLNEITFQRSNGLSKSQLLKKENNNFNTKINLGNICFNNTLKRPSKTEIKNDNTNNESNLIHHYEAKKEGNNISENEFNQNKNNKVKIIKK